MSDKRPVTVEQYIDAAPEQARPMLRELRALLQNIVPEAAEDIKWGAPVFEQNRILFSYKAFGSHINFMPLQSSIAPFKAELDSLGYSYGKDTIRLPYDRPLPNELISKPLTVPGTLWKTARCGWDNRRPAECHSAPRPLNRI